MGHRTRAETLETLETLRFWPLHLLKHYRRIIAGPWTKSLGPGIFSPRVFDAFMTSTHYYQQTRFNEGVLEKFEVFSV